MSTLTMELPGDVLESARMTVREAKLELAELAPSDFQMHLGTRHIGPHCDAADAAADAATLASMRE